jgi:hypothetical protein
MNNIAGIAIFQWGHEKKAQTINPRANPLIQKKIF